MLSPVWACSSVKFSLIVVCELRPVPDVFNLGMLLK